MMNFKITKKIFYQFLIPVVVAVVFELINKGYEVSTVYNFIENSLFSMILVSPVYFIVNRKLHLWYITLTFLVFCLSIYFETVYYYFFETYLSASSLFVLFDSNSSEAAEFLDFYVDYRVIIFSVLMLFVIITSTLKIKSLLRHFNKTLTRTKILTLIYIFLVLAFLKFSGLIVYNLAYLILKSTIEYTAESNKLGAYKTNKTGNFNNVSRPIIQEDEVYVIVLGESTSRSHFGLYDYSRPTTPKLNFLKDELIIYNDVISPHAHSIASITKVFTLGNYEHPDKIGDGSIIQLANKANFETVWLSNQRPIGIYESLVTKIALSSNKSKFLTTTYGAHSKVKDAELLPELERVLSDDSSSKKFIIIHLMGTHASYVNRYPDTFNKFKDTPLSNYKSDETSRIINHYDNAVLYTDFVVSEIIQKVKALNTKSFVLYMSDHGEELFKDRNMAGHNEDVSTQDMYDVPFLLWQSDDYKEQNQLKIDVDRSYMLDDLFHSVADLLEISAKEVEEERSIFNAAFKDRKRFILESSEYDTYFNFD
ncbi:phosphoethanolamine transferase [Flavobacteriaceae bacterium]|jgi:heptose-I-phosphate ethanolaminephosphotransferase|nr:phosphoethanolamine transferase [Flavobacteriaceae bacterium]